MIHTIITAYQKDFWGQGSLGHLSQCCEAFNARASSLSSVEIQALKTSNTWDFYLKKLSWVVRFQPILERPRSLFNKCTMIWAHVYIMMALSKANLVSAFCEANKAKFRGQNKM
jgi:hypothetical protein